MIRFLIATYGYFERRRKLLTGGLLLLVAGLLVSVWRLEYKEDIADFFPNTSANQHIHTVYQQIGNSNKLMVCFSPADSTLREPERMMGAIDRFVCLLGAADSLHVIPEVVSQIDEGRMLEIADFIQDHAPYFLTEADYLRIDSLIASEDFVATQLRENKKLLLLPSGGILKQSIRKDPLHLFSPLLFRLQEAQTGSNRELNRGYIFFDKGRKGLVMITSPYGTSETKQNVGLMEMINRAMQQTMQEEPNVTVSCFGIPAVSVTNANQIKKDGLLAVLLAAALISLILGHFFRSRRNIAWMFVAVLFGWLFALGVFALLCGTISLIAVGISSIFIGIAINYPLHLIDHVRSERNIKQVIKEITPPLLTGNITTVGAFLSLIFIDSSAMRDLGLCGSLILIGTILFVLIYLPHFVRTDAQPLGEASRTTADLSGGRGILDRLAAFAPEKKGWILCLVAALTLYFFHLSRSTAFELDMDKISYMTEQQKADMKTLESITEHAHCDIIYLVSEGKDTDHALMTHESNKHAIDSLRKRNLIESLVEPGIFLASKAEQLARIHRWNSFWAPRKAPLLQQIEHHRQKEKFKPDAFTAFAQLIETNYIPLETNHFAPLTNLLNDGFLIENSGPPLAVARLYCKKENTATATALIKRLATGASVFDSRSILQHLVDSLADNFNQVLYICGLIVFIFLLLAYRRIELTLIAFLPLAVAWIWILGIMQCSDMKFNIVSIVLATFIFGQGDDYTLFILNGLTHEYTYRRQMLARSKNTILLSALILLAGIGTLIISKHPAMRSLAQVTIIGMISVVIMAYTLPPFLFRLLTQNRSGYRTTPLTIATITSSLWNFLLFTVGCILVTFAGFLLFFPRKNSPKRKQLYHSLLHRTVSTAVHLASGIRFRFHNPTGETFTKPAIIIGNHQSNIDLLALILLTPRLIVLTNDWVWNNPLFGRLIKYADFYPISNGLEQGINRLEQLFRQGYSIAIFPEGTRSNDGSILRFHKGAFYLAERFQADIIPIVLHGAKHLLPKRSAILRSGQLTIQIHPRSTYPEGNHNPGYVARSKHMRRYYQQAYNTLARQEETTHYFHHFVRMNYLYKGIDAQRTVSHNLKKHHCYTHWIDLPTTARTVLIINSGYGEFALLFALVHPDIAIHAIESDPDQLSLSQNCAGKPNNLTISHPSDLPDHQHFDTAYLLHPDTNPHPDHHHTATHLITIPE
jgi:1-acyl-sn-glycerol-3-phosphate acyltransferase